MEQAVEALKGSLRSFAPYTDVGAKAKQQRRAVLQDLLRTFLVNPDVTLKGLGNGDFIVTCGAPGDVCIPSPTSAPAYLLLPPHWLARLIV